MKLPQAVLGCLHQLVLQPRAQCCTALTGFDTLICHSGTLMVWLELVFPKALHLVVIFVFGVFARRFVFVELKYYSMYSMLIFV